MSLRNEVWLEETLGTDPARDQQTVEAIGSSDMNVVLLAFLHPHSTYDLFYNDTQLYQEQNGELVAVDPQLIATIAELLGKLKSGFPTPKKLVMSIGPFQSDFDAIGRDIPQFVDNFLLMQEQLGLDGMDFDFEGSQTPAYRRLLGNLAVQYATQAAQPPVITAAPYFGEQWWAEILERTESSSGNYFSWWNVQFYAGTGNTSPSEAPSVFEGWRSAVAKVGANVADPSAFLTPGINANPKASPVYDPSTYGQFVSAIRGQYSTMGGAFVWRYKYVEDQVQAWAQAVEG